MHSGRANDSCFALPRHRLASHQQSAGVGACNIGIHLLESEILRRNGRCSRATLCNNCTETGMRSVGSSSRKYSETVGFRLPASGKLSKIARLLLCSILSSVDFHHQLQVRFLIVGTEVEFADTWESGTSDEPTSRHHQHR